MIPDPISCQTYHGLHHGYTMSGILQNPASPNETSTFPFRLHKVVEQAHIAGYGSVVSWLPDGRSFKVHNHDAFVDCIVPSYFSLTKYKSFLRQLTVYGFQRINKGPHKGGYFHPLFVRGKPNLVYSITRKPCKKSKSNPEKMKNTEKETTMESTTRKLPLNDEPENSSEGDEILSSKSMDACDTKQELPKTCSSIDDQGVLNCDVVSLDPILLTSATSDIDVSIKEAIKLLDHEILDSVLPDTTKFTKDYPDSHDLQSDRTVKSSSEDWWITQNENLWDSVSDMLGLKGEFVPEDVCDEIISTFSKP